MKRYRKKYRRFPLKIPRGPRAELVSKYEVLRQDVIPPPVRERPANRWISDKTWAVVDKRATMRRKGHLTTCLARRMGREIKSLLTADRKQRAANAASTVESHLSNGAVKEAWRALKGWYRSAEDRPPPACPETMVRQTAERVELYARAPPMGCALPFRFPHFEISDGMPTDSEVRMVVGKLRNGRAGGATGMKAEHIKVWLDTIQREEKAARANPGREADPGAGRKWKIFVELIQAVWERGEIPEQMSWMIVVLLPKGGGDYRGIGLLDPFWKVVEKIMVCRLGSIEFHPCLHGGLPKRGTGTATIEAKLAQQLAWMEQEPLYQVFVDLRKAYDHLDRERCLAIMTGYGVGPKLLRLQTKFWEQAQMVCRAGGSFGKPFRAYRGVTQGGPLSSLMFNICVDAVIREWLRRTMDEEAANGRFAEACREIVAFFVDDGLVGSRDPVWLQGALNVLVTLFESIGLRTNPDKMKVMTCVPGNIRVAHTEEAYHTQQYGPVNPTTKRHRVECDICGVSLAAGSLRSHLETAHDTYRSFVLNRELTVEREPTVYRATTDATGTYFCPVPACVGVVGSEGALRSHFLRRHPQDLVVCPAEGSLPLPQCDRCGLQISFTAINGRHYETALCKDGVARKVQYAAAERAHTALQQTFTAYGAELERVEVFKYLGRLLAYDDNDARAVRGNLKKARGVWARLSRTIRAENASPRACGTFYKATVQSILLFGSETWNLSPQSLKCLEGFHLRAAWRMAGKRPLKLPDGAWEYPNSAAVLDEVGLKTIAHYIGVRRQHIASYIVDKPIFQTCWDGVRKRGSSVRQFWWAQSMDLETARAARLAGPVVVTDDGEE